MKQFIISKVAGCIPNLATPKMEIFGFAKNNVIFKVALKI